MDNNSNESIYQLSRKLLEKSEKKMTCRKLCNNWLKFACFCFVTNYGDLNLVCTIILHILYSDIIKQVFFDIEILHTSIMKSANCIGLCVYIFNWKLFFELLFFALKNNKSKIQKIISI